MTVVSEKCSGSFCFSKAHKLTHELINLKKRIVKKIWTDPFLNAGIVKNLEKKGGSTAFLAASF